MREEDISAIQIVKSKQLGEVCFFRYLLSVGNFTEEHIPTAIFEAYLFACEINGKSDLESIYASASKNEQVILITGRGKNGLIVNLFFDFSGENQEPIKQSEIAGAKGMYQFDSTSETAFHSNFLTQEHSFTFKGATEQEQKFFEKIKESYDKNKLVFLGGNC